MKVLIACEESQEVCKAFRAKGHEAYSCDVLPCSGGRPEWHIQGDCIPVVYGSEWDLLIAHPPCTYICNSGAWALKKFPERWGKLREATDFFRLLMNAPIEKKCIENPIPHGYGVDLIGCRYTQLIQPYQFGHPESKATCLWLFGLPLLRATKDMKSVWKSLPPSKAQRLSYLPPGPDRARLRSKTFPGIAAAMAQQWG
jgi:hypothetical protein